MKKTSWLLTLLLLFLISCKPYEYRLSRPGMLSVSSDGRYVISTHYGRILILWDIAKRKRHILNHHTAIFSPYFIPNTHYFLWQDANDYTIHVQSVNGQTVRTFKWDFPVYGHVMTSDLKHYIAANEDWSLYHLHDNKRSCMKPDTRRYNFSHLFQLKLHEHFLLTCGGSHNDFPLNFGLLATDVRNIPKSIDRSLVNGTTLWDIQKSKPLMKFSGNTGKTKADLSPDAKYVISGDENIFCNVWETATGKRYRMKDPTNPHSWCGNNKKLCEQWKEEMRTNLLMPEDFYNALHVPGLVTVAMQFIDEHGHFLRFFESTNYAVLYAVGSPKVQGYMAFGHNPVPYTESVFDSANTIAAAPKAQILVMAQRINNQGQWTGIIVYHFNEKTKQLERIWAPEGPPPHQHIPNLNPSGEE